jgi:hypothetical protein
VKADFGLNAMWFEYLIRPANNRIASTTDCRSFHYSGRRPSGCAPVINAFPEQSEEWKFLASCRGSEITFSIREATCESPGRMRRTAPKRLGMPRDFAPGSLFAGQREQQLEPFEKNKNQSKQKHHPNQKRRNAGQKNQHYHYQSDSESERPDQHTHKP